jgi:hypothetical protein
MKYSIPLFFIILIYIGTGSVYWTEKLILTKVSNTSTKSYQKNILYRTPWGNAGIKVIIQKDSQSIIKTIKVTSISWDGTSRWYIDSFTKKIGNVIIWKNIRNLSLKAIGGASLTTNAFNAYIKTIK